MASNFLAIKLNSCVYIFNTDSCVEIIKVTKSDYLMMSVKIICQIIL